MCQDTSELKKNSKSFEFRCAKPQVDQGKNFQSSKSSIPVTIQ